MSESFKSAFAADGYVVARGLFTEDEVDGLRSHVMALQRSRPGSGVGTDEVIGERHDPLRRYPRMAQLHRWDPVTLRWLLDRRLADTLTLLLGAQPFAVQSMVYFKPAGSRGQALHQDNFYLRAEPGTCVAAWLALDPTDDENGCLMMVPGSHQWPILCTE